MMNQNMKTNLMGYGLQAPLVLLALAGFLASAYLALTKSDLVAYPGATAVTFAVILILYVYGSVILARK